ncbi:MAG: SUMF1/EgtB/PvdO family nonheme iron enzyme [Sandaracinus sp.]|nr:SUMF1/EgtB/PvdO family nonheme iron enzyme [Sandaracinus sp.]MCB9625147.1 SUMF1/EgtB/PvdO family nonheme iron enzyme [Sandaracinus sp.]
MAADDDTFHRTVSELEGTALSEVPAPRVSTVASFSLAPPELATRYVLGEELGRGQQGIVYVAEDRVLRRRVAMKLLAEPWATDAGIVARFVVEAQLTAQLEHPHIVPIHDAGRWLDGRPFYTMPLLSGRSLAERLDGIRAGATEPLVRLVRWFSSACMAIHAAHEVGVAHRDLKPGNLVVGPTEELLVADFGLARFFREASTVQTDAPLERTAIGSPVGTPFYMPPEQARGEHDATGPWSDVYALGAILYELLTLRPPFVRGSFAELVVAILDETPRDPREVAPDREVPRDLAELALRCLAKAPADRPPSAAALVETIEGWLDGRFESERRAAEIDLLFERAVASRIAAAQVGSALESRRRSLRERWVSTPEHAPVDQKEPLWLEEAGLAEIERQREEHEAGAIGALEAALRLRSDDRAARELLASLHLERRERFVARREHERALEEERRARTVAPDDVERRLHAPATLHVRCSGEVQLARYEDEAGRRRPRTTGELARGVPVELAPGSYRLQSEVDTRVVYLPFELRAGESREVCFVPESVRELPHGLVLVHGGRTRVGGDEREEQVVDVASFALALYPVTCREYLVFLNEAFADVDEGLAHAPRPAHDAPSYWSVEDGAVVMPSRDADGDTWDPRFPVFGVSAHDAEAFLAWRSTRDSVRYRLPTELEWERAARGADGRLYPWGDRFDPALCKMRLSRAGGFSPEPVGAFATDVSPFGVRDLAGGIAEWTSSSYADDAGARCVKGGAWSTRAHRCAASFRAMMLAHHVSGDLGFRLAMDVGC